MKKRSFEYKLSFDTVKEMLKDYLDSEYSNITEEGFGGFFQDALFLTPYNILNDARTIEDLNDFTNQYFNININTWLNLSMIKINTTIDFVVA